MKRNLYRHARKQGRPLTVTIPAVTPPPPVDTSGQPALPPDVTTGVANSRIITWSGLSELYLDNTTLDDWANNRHIGGIGIILGFLYGSGGTTTAMTAAANPTFNSADGRTGDEWTRARQMKNSNFVSRCNARGMEVYLGMYQVNYNENFFLAGDWFDDTKWASWLSTSPTDGEGVFNWAAHASRSGCAGFLFDGENYTTIDGNANETWEWNYPGNTHSESATRAKAKQRGAEMMTCILAGWQTGGNPNPPKFQQYTSEALWRSHRALVFLQPLYNLGPDWGIDFLYHDFWEGMCSVAGYGKITHVDANFHKSPQISGMTWDSALQYGTNALQAGMSRWFAPAVWKLACQKIGHNAQHWIDRGQTDFEQVVAPGASNVAMQAFRKFGTNGEWSLYGHHFLDSTVNPDEGGPTNYPWSAYWSALASAANTTSPDNTVPTLNVTVGTGNILQGTASHPIGVRCVEWERRTGATGATVADSGAVQMDWAAENITNVTPGFYANKPMSFGEVVSGGDGAWYVVTATSFLGTSTSRVIQAPGGTVVTPPEDLPEDIATMFPDVIYQAGAEYVATDTEVDTAASQGLTMFMHYSIGAGDVADALTANGMKYLDRSIADLIYAVLPANNGGSLTQPQEDAIVADAITYLDAAATNDLIAGHYILDDWPGDVLNCLKRITAEARVRTPTKPTIVAFVGIWDFWNPADTGHTGTLFPSHSAFDRAIVNYHPDACDIPDFYIYGVPGVIGVSPPATIPPEHVDWTGANLWPYIKSTLISKGWDPATGFMFTPQTFTSTVSPHDPVNDYPDLSATDIETQVQYAVAAGANSILAYAWYQFDVGQSLTNKVDWQLGYENAIGQAKNQWRGLPIDIIAEYDARVPRTIHATGANVDILDNASGSLWDLDFGSGTPKTGTRTINGHNVIDFGTTANDALFAGGGITLTPPYTLFIFVQSDLTTQTGYFFTTDTALNFGQVGTQWTVAVAAPFGGGTVDAQPHVLTLVNNGASSLLYIDSALIATGTCPATTATIFGLGGDAGGNVFNGAIGHAMIWPGLLFAPDRAAIETFIRDSWA